MVCKSCGSSNVTIEIIQSGGNVKKRGKGINDYLLNFFRILVGICTVGIAFLFWRKSEGKNKIEFKSTKTCVCHDCGYSWELEQ